jgi:acyl carrier protein
VTTQAAAVLRFEADDVVDPARAFRDLGFDSLTAVDLRNALTKATGLSLPTTLVFDHPNALALAEHLHRLVAPAAGTDDIGAGLDQLEHAVATGDIAEAERSRITERLQLLLHRVGRAGDEDCRTVLADGSTAARLDTVAATDDDLFAFIDDQLGRP